MNAKEFTDSKGIVWARDGEDCKSSSGQHWRISPEMTNEYLLSQIELSYNPPVQLAEVISPEELTARLKAVLTLDDAQAAKLTERLLEVAS